MVAPKDGFNSTIIIDIRSVGWGLAPGVTGSYIASPFCPSFLSGLIVGMHIVVVIIGVLVYVVLNHEDLKMKAM